MRSHQYRPNYRIIIISHCHHLTILFHHSPASSSVHNGLASLLTKERGESALVMSVEVILDKRLTTKLVHTLSDLVASSKAKTREKGGILLHEGFVGSILIQHSSVPCLLTHPNHPCIVPESSLTLKTILLKAAWLSAKVLPPPKTYYDMKVSCLSTVPDYYNLLWSGCS